MRIFKVKLPYAFGDSQDAVRAQRLANFTSLGYRNHSGDDKRMGGGEILLTERQFIDASVLMPDVAMKIVEEVEFPSINDVDGALAKIEAVVGKIEGFANMAGNNHFNEKVEVYTPGMGLMLFNRTMLLQDGCSDALQTELDNGWRIIAACPQPDQRRPDYILGRYQPDDEPGAMRSALRGR